MNVTPHIEKGARYTIGARIENKFLDLLEESYETYFTSIDNKPQKIVSCILLLDILKFLVHTTWELKLISHKQYIELGKKLEEVGKMLGGWKKSLENPEKKNRTM